MFPPFFFWEKRMETKPLQLAQLESWSNILHTGRQADMCRFHLRVLILVHPLDADINCVFRNFSFGSSVGRRAKVNERGHYHTIKGCNMTGGVFPCCGVCIVTDRWNSHSFVQFIVVAAAIQITQHSCHHS